MPGLAADFFRNALATPGKTAIRCDDAAMSYAQLAGLVMRWGEFLTEKGVRRGEHVGVVLPNCIEFVGLMLTAADCGAVLVPVSPSLPTAAIHRAFQVADVKHLVATAEILEALRGDSECDFAFADGCWLAIDGGCGSESVLPSLSSGSPGVRPQGSGREDDPFILTMTSGSTGDPKPIVLTQRTKYNRARAAVELYAVTAADTTLAATPLYHSLAERLVLIPLLTGGTSLLMATFSPSEWLRCVREQGVSFTIAVSSQLRQIAERLAQDGEAGYASLRCVVSSSAQLDAPVKELLLATLSCHFHECYGTSEIAIATNLDTAAARGKLQSVGNPAPGVQVRILRQDGEEAAPGEVGEIVCSTPMRFAGYYRLPELTRAAMWGDFFRTGDLGRLDEDGYLYYLGRLKDIVITGGINVYPKDIEALIAAHPDVVECAVFPLPDARLGEIVAVALVVRDPGRFDLRRLRIACARQLADFQQPRKFYVMDELPKNAMGKIMKRALPACCAAHARENL